MVLMVQLHRFVMIHTWIRLYETQYHLATQYAMLSVHNAHAKAVGFTHTKSRSALSCNSVRIHMYFLFNLRWPGLTRFIRSFKGQECNAQLILNSTSEVLSCTNHLDELSFQNHHFLTLSPSPDWWKGVSEKNLQVPPVYHPDREERCCTFHEEFHPESLKFSYLISVSCEW